MAKYKKDYVVIVKNELTGTALISNLIFKNESKRFNFGKVKSTHDRVYCEGCESISTKMPYNKLLLFFS